MPDLPSRPPVEFEPWASAPTQWPALELPPTPEDPTTAVSRAAAIGALVASALLIAVFGVAWRVTDHGSSDAEAASTTTTTSPLPAGVIDIHAVLDKVEASVVTIQIGATSESRLGGAGTGILLNADGLVLTNAHVVAGANGPSDIEVTLFDGSRHTAELIGSLPDDDVALVQIQGVSDLAPAELGSSADVQVGDDVVAIGNAFNLGGRPSVTKGIVSAKNRIIEGPGYSLTGLIQTDAAINPGNSGGPLVNAAGQVVGVNTAIIEASQNAGFAIGIDVVKPLIDDIENGKGTLSPNDAVMGVRTQDLTELSSAAKNQFGISADSGAFVVDVPKGSAAAKAGIELGDVITGINGVKINNSQDVENQIREHQPGDQVTVSIERFGDKQTVSVTLARRGG